MTDVLWSRNVRARLRQQYPRIPARDIDVLLAVCLDVLESELPAGQLERAVEDQVRASLHSLSAALPDQRRGLERVPTAR